MKKPKYLYQCAAVMVFAAFIFTFAISAGVISEKSNNDANAEKRADVITINTLKSFGDLDRKEVPFLHDAHTAALEKNNKSCEECHLQKESSDNETLSFKFKRLEDESRQQVMDVYHTNCIACHKEMSAGGIKSGPTELCGECHKGQPSVISSRLPVSFDKFLHSFHTEIIGEDCNACHHDNKKEDSCRNCHKNEGSNKLISIKTASHLSCISCHREISGPTKCNECHGINEQQQIDRSSDVTRLMRDQPDVVLLGAGAQVEDARIASTMMNPILFDHKSHEENQDSCRICHHKGIESCSKTCHTNTGSEKGNMIRTEQAMHQLGNEQSCLGCHEVMKNQKECAGCHSLISKDSSMKEDTCQKCHMERPKAGTEKDLTPEAMAAMLLESRKAVSDTFNDEDIPEIVTIEELSFQYGSVELPHRQIISALLNDIEDNKLASYFHSEKGTVCQACHHNSPVKKTPPACSSCHGKPFDDRSPLKPGLKAAYHQQCMGCHDSMGIEKPKSTDCVSCHKVIGVNKLYDF